MRIIVLLVYSRDKALSSREFYMGRYDVPMGEITGIYDTVGYEYGCREHGVIIEEHYYES